MVKFYSTSYTYDYPFPTVSLAYFLRYPNPYSLHVASTDTISRTFDPETQRLTTIRLHLKRSRVPPTVARLLPKSASAQTGPDGRTQSFILEKSVVDVREGWMETESRNLDWRDFLSVEERHSYRRSHLSSPSASNGAGAAISVDDDGRLLEDRGAAEKEKTDVSVTVILKSRIGEQIRKRRQRWGEQASATSVTDLSPSTATLPVHASQPQTDSIIEEPPQKPGWFSTWSTGAVRSAIEAVSLQRTERSQPKAKEGMSVVLARLREGGLQAVFEGMEKDRRKVAG